MRSINWVEKTVLSILLIGVLLIPIVLGSAKLGFIFLGGFFYGLGVIGYVIYIGAKK